MKEWNDLKDHLEENYHKPDIGALATALSVATAHYFPQDEPIWLMIVGPPGSGKTSVCINSVLQLPWTYNIDTLTPNTFLSGFSKGAGGNCSLLNHIGTQENRSGILTMAEFSAFLGLREENRREIGSQMRRIYDGYLDRATGVGWLEWSGKVTFIVAATSGAERTWGTMKDLGERFMTIRWPRGDGIEQAKKAQQQIGREEEIKSKTAELLQIVVGENFPLIRPGQLSGEEINTTGIAYLAEIVAITRAKVERDKSWKREIIEEPEPEGPTRIMKAMCQVAAGHASLMRRCHIDNEDLKVSKRLAIDSIPPARWNVISAFRSHSSGNLGTVLGFASLLRRTQIPQSTLNWALEELEHLGIVEMVESAAEKQYRLTDGFQELLVGSNYILGIEHAAQRSSNCAHVPLSRM